jgi:predicted DNA-binding transcriptional regulator AlpA
VTREITSQEAAELAGVKRDTFSGYVTRGQAPKPIRHVGRTPLWDEDEIKAWMENRPGLGARTTDRALRRAAERAAHGADPADRDDSTNAK